MFFLLVFGAAFGFFMGWIVFADHLGERGKFIIGAKDTDTRRLSAWEHDGRLYVSEDFLPDDPDDPNS